MQGKVSSSLLIGFILVLPACNSGEEIPQKSDTAELEEIIDTNIEAVEQEAKSIKEAAAEAVKIIEQDSQTEIDNAQPLEIDNTIKNIQTEENVVSEFLQTGESN